MEKQQISAEHRERVTHACRLAINHAALLCASMRGFVAEATSKEVMDRTNSLRKMRKLRQAGEARYRDSKRSLTKAETNLILAVEKLFHLHAKQTWVSGRDFQDLLLLCWNGVAEVLDRENEAKHHKRWEANCGPLTLVEQTYHEKVVLPLIQGSFEAAWAANKELRN